MRFLKLSALLLVITSLGSLTACNSIPVNQDYSAKSQLVNYQSYQWFNPNNSVKQQQPFVAERIENAILKNLHARNALIVRQQPQGYIGYDYRITRTEKLEPSTTIGVGIGSGNVGFRGMFPVDYETRVYEDATWQVDIYDANKKLIWRGTATKPVTQFNSPKDAQAYTKEIIDAIMAQYPPK